MDTQSKDSLKSHTIISLFEERACSHPQDFAILVNEQQISYEDLNHRANQYAAYLTEQGVGPEVLVGVCMHRSAELLMVLLAILKAGGAYVPLDAAQPKNRLLSMLDAQVVPFLVLDNDWESRFEGYQGTYLGADTMAAAVLHYSSRSVDRKSHPDNLAYVIYTSGSTGTPKGVLIEHRSVVNYALWFQEYSCCQPQQRIDFSSNHAFDMVVTTTLVPLMLGLTVVICKDDEVKQHPRHYLQYLEHYEINTIKMTPGFFKVLLYEVQNHFVTLPDLSSIILGGENLSAQDCRAWLKIYPDHVLHNEYGPTEATVGVLEYPVTKETVDSTLTTMPIGVPGPAIQCYIIESTTNQLVADGEVGELCIGGVCLARGYLERPELTSQMFVALSVSDEQIRVYKTGDLCRKLPDGNFECLGRMDHQVKVRGFRIELGEIERCLSQHPGIQDAVVLVQEDAAHDKKLVAYFIVRDGQKVPTVLSLRQFLESYLPDYMIPVGFVKVATFPLNANGKLDRRALPVPEWFTSQHHIAPSNELEKVLATIWSEELGSASVGIEDNFFELGGHSLIAARIVSKINRIIGKDIMLHDFYQAATIQKLVLVIQNANVINSDQPLPVLIDNKETLLPLSDFQLLLWLANTFEPKASNLNIISRKRWHGDIDIFALMSAIESVIAKHEVLSYQICALRPAQVVHKVKRIKLKQQDISPFDDLAREKYLNTSLQELLKVSWDTDTPLLHVRLFSWCSGYHELQVAMPHMISDDASLEIFYRELSYFYLLHQKNGNIRGIEHQKIPVIDQHYRDYLANEQHYSLSAMNRDMLFWDQYLSDAGLFEFPIEKVVINPPKGFVYSTYHPIPQKKIIKLQKFCAKNQLSISDGLSAILVQALVSCSESRFETTKKICINRIKSTREHHLYDDTMGCFLRLEPIKIELSNQHRLLQFAKQAHHSVIETAPFRRCFSLLKLTSISTFRSKRTMISDYVLGMISYAYTFLFRTPKLNPKLLNVCGRLALFKRKNNFLINMNVWNNFIGSTGQDDPYFRHILGYSLEKVHMYSYDLLKIENVLEVCFLRDEAQNIPYIVISGNLDPAFREKIAKEMVRIIHTETQQKML